MYTKGQDLIQLCYCFVKDIHKWTRLFFTEGPDEKAVIISTALAVLFVMLTWKQFSFHSLNHQCKGHHDEKDKFRSQFGLDGHLEQS